MTDIFLKEAVALQTATVSLSYSSLQTELKYHSIRRHLFPCLAPLGNELPSQFQKQ